MATVVRRLPPQPNIEVPKREARELLTQCRAGVPDALERFQRRHPKFPDLNVSNVKPEMFRLSDAQLVISREYGFSRWADLKSRIELDKPACELETAIRNNDCDEAVRLLTANPRLLHIPVRSGNWGPPMSFAANMGRLEIVKAAAKLGGKDFQHALDRAVLLGRIDCAAWLHEHGATFEPGIVMGACETLNSKGLRFLSEKNAPFTDRHGNPLAPLTMLFETYSRGRREKHESLEIFAARGFHFPDTPIMAFHRGQVERLRQFVRQDPSLLERRFTYREIYPPELGCADDGRSGLHGTPIDGATLLHLAVDFDEQEIFDFLIEAGADVNARATSDSAGFGGHTPMFNALVSCAYSCGLQRDARMARTLLERGASLEARANLRKFLDWVKTPRWHEAHNVTPEEWARNFPETNWVNREAMEMIARGSS